MTVTEQSTHPAQADSVFASIDWLAVPDVAERLGVPVTRVHQYARDGQLISVRIDGAVRIPADVLDGNTTLKYLPGVLTVLRDGGYTDEEILEWLFADDDSLPGRPIDAVRNDRHKEITRRAQAML